MSTPITTSFKQRQIDFYKILASNQAKFDIIYEYLEEKKKFHTRELSSSEWRELYKRIHKTQPNKAINADPNHRASE